MSEMKGNPKNHLISIAIIVLAIMMSSCGNSSQWEKDLMGLELGSDEVEFSMVDSFLILNGSDAILGLDRKDGNLRWRASKKEIGYASLRNFSKGLFLVDSSLSRMDPSSGKIIWTTRINRSNDELLEVAHSGNLLIVGIQNRLLRLNPHDGILIDSISFPFTEKEKVLVDSERIIVCSSEQISVLSAQFLPIWNVLDSALYLDDVVSDGKILALSNSLYGLQIRDLHDGRLLWRSAYNQQLLGPVAIDSGIVYFSDQLWRIRALECSQWRKKWEYEPEEWELCRREWLCHPPVVDNQMIYFGGNNFDKVIVLDKRTGIVHEIIHLPHPMNLNSNAEGRFYVNSNVLYYKDKLKIYARTIQQ